MDKYQFAVVAALTLFAADPAHAQAPDPALLARAQKILDQVHVIDGHNDLPSELLSKAGADPLKFDLSQRQDTFMTDFLRAKQGRLGAQFWSAYVDNDSIPTGAAMRVAMRQIDMVHRMTDAYPTLLEFARTADDIERIEKSGKLASLIGLEGGHGIQGSLAALRMFHDLGVRYMTLTHNTTLSWADAALDMNKNNGLTEYGEEVVREMNRVGIFVDLSHVSAETMRDALRVSRAPVIFSHSSARELVNYPRNVPDDVLRLLPKNGGVIMVTFVPDFDSKATAAWYVSRDSAMEAIRTQYDGADERAHERAWYTANPTPHASIGDVANMIDHVKQVAGIDYIGIGSDFDGIERGPDNLTDVSMFPNLFAELLRRGYSDDDLKKIAGLNLLRAMRGMEETARRLQVAEKPRIGG